ncbi:3-hydroxyacyl-CoA dehydrogenase NAD-binding domain-containing protein [Saccharopolyspora tripterygii]
MGSGIAEVCARSGLDVVISDVDQCALDAGRSRIERSLHGAVDRGKRPRSELPTWGARCASPRAWTSDRCG